MTEPERLRVNPIACDAHGLCADLFPEMIRLDEWGYPLLDGRDVPEALLGHARRAVAACPTLALALVRRTPAAPLPAGPLPAGPLPAGPVRPAPAIPAGRRSASPARRSPTPARPAHAVPPHRPVPTGRPR